MNDSNEKESEEKADDNIDNANVECRKNLPFEI